MGSGGLPHPRTATELQSMLRSERSGRPFLICRNEAGEQILSSLPEDREVLTIGRRAENDLVLEWDAEVSRVHAQLRRIAGDWSVADHGLSRNGTFVNGQRLSGDRRLHDGDSIRIGTTLMLFRDPAQHHSSIETEVGRGLPVGELTDAQRRVLLALCRPLAGAGFAAPASNQAIAKEVALSVDAVKGHLRTLFQKLGVAHLPQIQKRAALVERAFMLGLVDDPRIRGPRA